MKKSLKILLVNKFHYVVGGSETYYFALKRLLEEQGHTVIEFSMKHDKNLPSPYESYFVENVDYHSHMSLSQKIKASANIIYSREARDKFRKLVIDTQPDIVHLHLFQHQISPSILDVCKEFNLPVVYTAHELKMICPNYKMMHHGTICEDCKGSRFYKCLANRCVMDSFAKSLVSTAEAYVHKWKKSYDVIDHIITPSEFYRQKFIEFGIAPERVTAIPNFLDREMPKVNQIAQKDYYLYMGRLSEEKGILTMLRAFQDFPDQQLRIVGRGPLEDTVKQIIVDNHMINVTLLGFKSGQELTDILGNSKALILPSEWYENGPYSAIEALQLGIPIIGADIGGIPELIDNNGVLFKSGDSEDLKRAIIELGHATENEYNEMIFRSKNIFDEKYTAKPHFDQLGMVYEKTILRHKKVPS